MSSLSDLMGGPPPLPAPVPGETFELRDPRAGGIRMYVAGPAGPASSVEPPLLVIHSVNAAASAIETLPIYEHGAKSRRTYALDLPGFGLSERSDRRYDPRLMTDAILAAIAAIQERQPGARIDALALSLSCEFLARAARDRPDAFRSLALVSPTGFSGSAPREEPEGSTAAMPWFHRIVAWPGWSDALFRTLTRPSVVRYFLERTWGRKEIDERVWEYAVATAKVPGAKHAPLYFLSGHLFSTDVGRVYRALTLPVWMCHGVRGDFVDYRGAKAVADAGNWQTTVFETGALPHFEVPDAFLASLDAFLAVAVP